MEGQNSEKPKDNPKENILQSAIRDAYQIYRKVQFNPDCPVNNNQFIGDLAEKTSVHYDSVSIPPSYIEQHEKSIIFVPPNFSSLRGIETEESLLLDEALKEGLDHKLLTSPESLEQVLSFLTSKLTPANQEIIKKIYFRAIRDYLENLELYRLVQNPGATIFRFRAKDSEEDIEADSMQELEYHLWEFNPLVKSRAKKKVITFWWRREYDESKDEYGYILKTDRTTSTIAEKEKDYWIALDIGEDEALALIKK